LKKDEEKGWPIERDEVKRGEEEVVVTCEMCRSGSVGLGVGSGEVWGL
jgi:hypothetical protein